MSSIELLIDGLDFGEGPRWHDGMLWYSDFFQHRVYTVSLEGKRETVLDLGEENHLVSVGCQMAIYSWWECWTVRYSAMTETKKPYTQS